MIPPTINTHINCSNNSKSAFGALSKQQQGALKGCVVLHFLLVYLHILFFKMLNQSIQCLICFGRRLQYQKSKTRQDASDGEQRVLVLTKSRFLLEAKAFTFKFLIIVSLQIYFA